MLHIKTSQFAELEQHAHNDFVRRMTLHFRALYPDVYYRLPHDHIQEALERCIARARGYGLSSEFPIMRFVDYIVMLGWTFDTSESHQWIVRILNDNERSESRRIADIDIILFGGALEEAFHD